MQKLEEHTDDSFKQALAHLTEVPKVTVKISPPDDIHKEQLSLERSSDLHMGLYESSVSQKDKAEEDQMRSPNRKNLLQRSVNSNVKKMISAFENSPTQEPEAHVTLRTKPQSSRIDIGSSLKSAPLEESDTKKLKISKSLPKSFSAGMLSEINTPQKPKFSRSTVMKNTLNLYHGNRVGTMGQHSPLVNIKTHSNFKKMESSEQKADNTNSFEGSSVDTLRVAQSHSFKGMEAALTPSEMDQSPPTVSPHMDFDAWKEKIEVDASSQRSCSFHVDVASGKDDSMPSLHSGEKLVDLGAKDSPIVETTQTGVETSGHIVTSYIQLHHEENVELVHEEIKNKEQTLLDEGQQPSREKDEGSSFDAVEDDTHDRCFRSQSGDQSLSGSSNGTMELSTYTDYEKYPFQGLGIWKPRYLCITTGSKQLRNLVECCNVYVGTHPMASKLPNTESNEENKMVSSSSEKLNLENSVGIPKWNRGLVGQGVQILFIMVACGTLLFNTRQTKHR